MRDSLEVFTFIRFVNMSRPLRQICQLEKPPASETTEPLAFTVCKVELCSTAVVLQSHFRCTRFRPVVNNNWQKRRKVTCNKLKETEEQSPKRDYKKALLTDIKSQIESIWYRISRISRLPRKVLVFWGL